MKHRNLRLCAFTGTNDLLDPPASSFSWCFLWFWNHCYSRSFWKFILVLVKKVEAARIAMTSGPYKASRKNLGIKYGELPKISFGIGIQRSKQRPRKKQCKWNSNALQYSQTDYSGHLPYNQKGSSYILEGHLDKRQVLNLENRCSSAPEKRQAEHGRQGKRPLDDDPFSGTISAPLLTLHPENDYCSDVLNWSSMARSNYEALEVVHIYQKL